MTVAARRALSITFVFTIMVSVCVLTDASASAEIIRRLEFSFGGSETPTKSFAGGLGTVAIDQASGDVYVEDDNSTEAVYRFDAAGKYLGEITGAAVPQGSLGLFLYTSGIAVDNSSGPDKGDLYVAGTHNNVLYRFDASGKLLSQLNGSGTPAGSFTPGGVAVDASGNVYVADRANDAVDKFDASGAYIGQIVSPEIISPPTTIAVDSSDNVYLTNFQQDVVKLEPDGTASVLDANRPVSVGVDPATDDVYVAENYYPAPGRIVEYGQSGNRLGVFGEEQISSNVLGIAVDGVTGEVYAADYATSLVDVFGPEIVIPDTTTEAASSVQPDGVTLNGTVDPDSLPVTGCQFEYGTSTSYGQSVPCTQPSSIGSGTSPVAVSASVSGLQPDTEYHFRLDASNTNGTNHGSDVALTTTGPSRIDSESVTNINHTTASLQGQVNPFGFDTSYRFEYGPSKSYGANAPVPNADIGSGISDVAVSQGISGLAPGAVYHYRLVATSLQGTVDGPDQTFTTAPPAYIDAEYVSNVASSSATIDAEVNPLGSNTEYQLEYGASTSYEHTLTGSVGEGMVDVSVGFHLQDLLKNTTYHYRFVVHNELGTVNGADHAFTTQLAGEELTLPDGRAWELVSPPDKKGALIGPTGNNGDIQAANDGNAISYLSSAPVGENPEGHTQNWVQVLSMRAPGGWKSDALNLPRGLPGEGERASTLGTVTLEFQLFSADLSLALVEPQETGRQLPLSPEATQRTLYLRKAADGSYLPLVTAANVPPGTEFGGYIGEEMDKNTAMEFLAGTPDMSHVILTSPAALTPESINGLCHCSDPINNLYEWSAGRLQLVSILPDGEPVESQDIGGESGSGGGTGRYDEARGGARSNGISSDGRMIVWRAGFALYVRDMIGKRTVQVGGPNALFEDMSSDGSKIFFKENNELYELDLETKEQIDLTANHNVGESNAGVKEAVLGVSEEGTYLYFVATGVLADGAVSGGDNLYVSHESGGEWSTTFIATLSDEDEPSWYSPSHSPSQPGVNLAEVTSMVSPNGEYAAFMSEKPLTGYDNIDASSGQPDEEVFLYDAVSGHLVCASCDPTGARPSGVLDSEPGGLLVDRMFSWANGDNNSRGGRAHWLAGSLPAWSQTKSDAVYQPRYLSDSGRLFFDSPDALVPSDTNGLEDVYQYEPVGVGGPDGCLSVSVTFIERSGGCVNLISSGTSGAESAFYDASANGDDVFFETASKLTAADYDTSYDVYDAHVCPTEVPCAAVSVAPPPCTTIDSCKAALSPQPEIFGPAPSATFTGTGNEAEVKSTGKSKRKIVKHKSKLRKKGKKTKRKAAKSLNLDLALTAAPPAGGGAGMSG